MDPSTQALADAKGSWLPRAMMNDRPEPFWQAALVLGIVGMLLIAVDRFMDWRKGRLARLRKSRLD